MSQPPRSRVFVSYSRADGRPWAEELSAAIAAAGLDPWLDREDLAPGTNWQREIERSLRSSVAVVVVVTPGAVASDEVMSEWSFAKGKGLPIIPFQALPCESNYRLALLQAVDPSTDPDATETLLARLRELADRGAERHVPATNPFVLRSGIKDPAWFFDRERAQASVEGFLAKRQNCQIIGPRRIGKTSLLLQVMRGARRLPAAVVAFMDFQSPQCETLRGWLKHAGEGFGWRRVPRNRVEFAEQVEQMIRDGRAPVLLLDEFDELVRRPKQFPYEFFTTLRSCSQNGMSIVTASRQRLSDLILGDNEVSRFFNIFPRLDLGPFTPSDAADFVTTHARFFAADEREAALQFACGHPLALQVVCYWVVEARQTGRGLPEALAVAAEEMAEVLPEWGRP